jgi:hypothetical protein
MRSTVASIVPVARPSAARTAASSLLALVVTLAAGSARADETRARRRVFGFGSAQGVTIAGGTLYTDRDRAGGAPHAPMLGATLPTFELRCFAPRLLSIDLSSAVTSTILAAALDHALYFTEDAYFSFHLGRGTARFVGGPGVGISGAAHDDERGFQGGASLRVVAQAGLELATKNEAFGFELLARPWLELTHARSLGEEHTFASGGIGFVFATFGYLRR